VVLEVGQLLRRVVDRCRSDAEHLVAAGSAHRVDAAKAAAMAEGQFRRVGSRAQVLGHLQLPLALDHLEHERQARDKADHRHKPRRATVGRDESVDIGQAVDPRRIFQVGAAGVLMAIAKAHQGFVGPGVVVEHRDFDDARVQGAFGHGLGFGALHRVEQHMGRNAVRVEADLEGGVGQAHIQHTVQRQAFHGAGHGHAFEESLQGHAVADLGEQVFVGAEAVADGGRFSHVCSSWNRYRKAGKKVWGRSYSGVLTAMPAWSRASRVASTNSRAPGVSLCRQMESNSINRSSPSTVRTRPV